MSTQKHTSPWQQMLLLADASDAAALETLVDEIGPSEAFRCLLRLNPGERERVLTTLDPEEAAELFEEIPDEHAANFVEQLSSADAALIVSEMESDDQADLLSELEVADADRILSRMQPDAAAEARELIQFPDDEAGGVMVTELVRFEEGSTLGQVIDDLGQRETDEQRFDDVYIYVVSSFGRLVGVIDMRDLVLAPRTTLLSDALQPALSVLADAPLNDLEEFFKRHEFYAVPVVDARHRLLGMVRRRDLRQALNERAAQDMLKMRGIVGGDEIRTLPLIVRTRRRLSWLSLNVVLNIVAASVIALYQDTLSAVIAFAVFLPIVSDMSGCSGNQAVAVSMRELSLGIVKPNELLRVWWQEIQVGIINGLVLGGLVASAAFLWQGNAYLGLVIGAALATNTVVSVSIGGTVPLLLKRFGIDPAIASGPILTTITDMCGFFLVLSFATLMLTRLV